MQQVESTVKGTIIREGELMVERTAGTFRSPWVSRLVVLTDVGLYVFELPRKRRGDERGAFLLMVPIETMCGVMLEHDKKGRSKKQHQVVVATFFKDHRFLAPSETVAQDWRRLLAQQMVGRLNKAIFLALLKAPSMKLLKLVNVEKAYLLRVLMIGLTSVRL